MQNFSLHILREQSRYAECEETPLLFSLLHRMKMQLKEAILVNPGRLNEGNHRMSSAPLYIKHKQQHAVKDVKFSYEHASLSPRAE